MTSRCLGFNSNKIAVCTDETEMRIVLWSSEQRTEARLAFGLPVASRRSASRRSDSGQGRRAWCTRAEVEVMLGVVEVAETSMVGDVLRPG
jgi:hypothetical protein